MPVLRPITAEVRRRAWGELGVRPWTFLTLLLLAVATFMAVGSFRAWRGEARLIRVGVPTEAEVVVLGNGAYASEGSRDEPIYVTLHYLAPGTNTLIEAGNELPRKPGTSIGKKDKLTVRVDPDHPLNWTERTEPPPIGTGMVAPGVCAAVAVACGAIAAIRRRGVTSAYAAAEPRRATVVSVRQSPLAPFSKLVGVSLEATESSTDADRRVRDCYWPNRRGTLHPQQTIDVLVAKNRTFAAAAYGDARGGPAGDVLE